MTITGLNTAVHMGPPPQRGLMDGFSIALVVDADGIGTTAQQINGIDSTGFTQMAAAGHVCVRCSGTSSSGVIATVVGISTGGRRISERITVGSTNTATSSTMNFRYFENAYLDQMSTTGSAITFETSGGTDITILQPGYTQTNLGQIFTGHKSMYLTMFAAGLADNPTDNVWFDLCWFPNDASCTSGTLGYRILSRLFVFGLTVNSNLAPSQPAPLQFAQPIRCPAGGWLRITGTAGAASSEAFVLTQGFFMDEGGVGGTIA